MHERPAHFRYLADPVCIVSLCLYTLNRFVLKPHHIGGWFTHGYFNDVLCLPLFVPMILYVQHLIGFRRHYGYPRAWEIFQNFAAFTIVFQLSSRVSPNGSFPRAIRGISSPIWPAGVIAGMVWSAMSRRISSRRSAFVGRDSSRHAPPSHVRV